MLILAESPPASRGRIGVGERLRQLVRAYATAYPGQVDVRRKHS